jgi:hypothetical protein
MARMTRVSVLTLVAASFLTIYGCSGSNDSPTTGGNAGAPVIPAAGAANVAGSPASAGAPGAGGTPGTAGGSGAPGTGGAPAAAGAGGASTAGAPGTGGASGTFSPLCVGLKTAAMEEPAKNIACAAATDPQTCYRTCGPQSSGFKSEICTGGLYAEQSGCTFPPTLDATCFKLPAAQDATCPATAPKASDPCTVAACTVCNLGGGPTGTYLDSKGAQKIGYCVCQLPTGGATTGKWSCGSTDAWPCPGAMGC